MTTPISVPASAAPAGAAADRAIAFDADRALVVPVQRGPDTAEAEARVREHVLAAIRARRPGLTVHIGDQLTSLGLDSLDRLAIATFLERTAGFIVPDPTLANAVTVAELVAAATPATRPLIASSPGHGHEHGQPAELGTDPHLTAVHRTDIWSRGVRSCGSDVGEEPDRGGRGYGWIDPGGHVGIGSRLWHQAQVSAGARVGADCTLGKGAFVGTGTAIGDRVKIGNYVSVFGAMVGDEAMICPGALLLEDPAPRATTTEGQRDGQRKSHDDFVRRPVSVGRGATIGAGAVVAPGVNVGDYAMVALGAVVAHDVPSHALVAGNPGRQCGWVCRCGPTLRDFDGELRCPACSRSYSRDGDRLTETTLARAMPDSP